MIRTTLSREVKVSRHSEGGQEVKILEWNMATWSPAGDDCTSKPARHVACSAAYCQPTRLRRIQHMCSQSLTMRDSAESSMVLGLRVRENVQTVLYKLLSYIDPTASKKCL